MIDSPGVGMQEYADRPYEQVRDLSRRYFGGEMSWSDYRQKRSKLVDVLTGYQGSNADVMDEEMTQPFCRVPEQLHTESTPAEMSRGSHSPYKKSFNLWMLILIVLFFIAVSAFATRHGE